MRHSCDTLRSGQELANLPGHVEPRFYRRDRFGSPRIRPFLTLLTVLVQTLLPPCAWAEEVTISPPAAAEQETRQQNPNESGSGPAKTGDSLAPAPNAAPADSADASAARPPVVVPPRALDTSVKYPAGSHGDARVLLELLISRDGAVDEARVLAGEPPFSSVALEQTRKWRFTPAQKGGRAVPARLRFEVRFSERQTLPQAAPQPVIGKAQQPERDAAAIEVVIEGDAPPGVSSYSRAEVREIPGSFGDPVRAIEVMPGVTPIISGIPLFFVRGAPPGNVGFFIDGIKVPLLYHAFLGPSVLQPAMIEKVTLYPGAYPAELGRYAGAIVDLSLAPVADELHAEGSLRLYDAGAFVSTPFSQGRGRVMAGGRYSYTGLILSLLTPSELNYWDYNTLASYDLTRTDTLSVFAFGSHEYFQSEQGRFGTEFHRLDLRYDRRLGHTGSLRIAMTFGSDETAASNRESDAGGSILSSETVGVRTRLSQRVADALTLQAGAEFILEGFDMRVNPLNSSADDVRRLFPPRTDWSTSAFASFTWQPDAAITFTPGLRADLYHSAGTEAVGVDPRIAARFRVGRGFALTHNWGIAHQIPSYVPNIPGAVVAGIPGGLQRSLQSSAGVEKELPWELTFKASVFQNVYLNLTDPVSLQQSFQLNADNANIRELGSGRGLEFQLQRPLGNRVGGLISYTLSHSSRSHGHIATRSAFDRPHVINAAVSYDLGRRWRLGVKGVFYSGVPGRRVDNGYVYDGARGRPFFRADLRLEKRFPLGERGYWAPVFEMYNATLSSEVTSRQQKAKGGWRETTVGPIPLPSLGIEARY